MRYSGNEPWHSFSLVLKHINSHTLKYTKAHVWTIYYECGHNHGVKQWTMKRWCFIRYISFCPLRIISMNAIKMVGSFSLSFLFIALFPLLYALSPSYRDVPFLSYPRHLTLQHHPGLSSWQGASFMRILQLADKRPCQTPFIALA